MTGLSDEVWGLYVSVSRWKWWAPVMHIVTIVVGVAALVWCVRSWDESRSVEKATVLLLLLIDSLARSLPLIHLLIRSLTN